MPELVVEEVLLAELVVEEVLLAELAPGLTGQAGGLSSRRAPPSLPLAGWCPRLWWLGCLAEYW